MVLLNPSSSPISYREVKDRALIKRSNRVPSQIVLVFISCCLSPNKSLPTGFYLLQAHYTTWPNFRPICSLDGKSSLVNKVKSFTWCGTDRWEKLQLCSNQSSCVRKHPALINSSDADLAEQWEQEIESETTQCLSSAYRSVWTVAARLTHTTVPVNKLLLHLHELFGLIFWKSMAWQQSPR